MAFLLCHVLVNTSHFPTILPTNAPNLRKTSRYILKHINTRRSPNPLQYRGLGDLTWHEWVHRKRIHGFLVRMRSAVRIRPAAPKSIENFGFRCFFVVKTLKEVWVNCLTHTVTHTRETYQEPAEPPGGSIALRPVALFLRFDTFLLFPAAQNMRRFALLLGVCRVNRTSL